MEQKEGARRLKNILAGILAVFSVILYSCGFEICEYFYEDDIKAWRSLRDLLTGISIFFLAILNLIPLTRLSRAVLVSLIFFCSGNLIDRVLFDIQNFVDSDYAVIVVAIIAGIITYYVKGRIFK